MLSSDAHLEKALEEYNAKVNMLEQKGTPRDLLDAYINRGCVLSMLECDVSAIDDFDEAIGIITDLENSGNSVDTGIFVKAYLSRGELHSAKNPELMADDYRVAVSRIPYLNEDSKYFDIKTIADVCATCAGDLVDNDFPADALSFADNCIRVCEKQDGDFFQNCLLDAYNIRGQALMDLGRNEEAYEYFCKAIVLGTKLFKNNVLDETMGLVLAYVSKGDLDEFFNKEKEFFADREAAIELMEDMKVMGTLDDDELLSNLHGEVAQAYMGKGMIKEAEKHLLKQALEHFRMYIQKFQPVRLQLYRIFQQHCKLFSL